MGTGQRRPGPHRYWTAFHQERAAQSLFGVVLCCSGLYALMTIGRTHWGTRRPPEVVLPRALPQKAH